MLWGQSIKVFTDNKNLTRDALGLTSDRVYRWRLLLEEYAPDIVYIKRVHNTVTDDISRIEFNPMLNLTNDYTHATVRGPTGEPSTDPSNWKMVAKHWGRYNECYATSSTSDVQMDTVFANRSEEDDICPLTAVEIAEAQKADVTYKDLFKRNAVIDKGLEIKLIENTLCVCRDGWLVIPKPLQRRAVLWYHHYLQHPGHTRLEEMMNATMYWKGMRTTIRSITKSCKTCQINKRQSNKYGHLPAKLCLRPYGSLDK